MVVVGLGVGAGVLMLFVFVLEVENRSSVLLRDPSQSRTVLPSEREAHCATVENDNILQFMPSSFPGCCECRHSNQPHNFWLVVCFPTSVVCSDSEGLHVGIIADI